MIAITSVVANLSAILGGILVFGEPIGSGAVGIISRLLAFCLVIAGAALVPALPLILPPSNRSRADPTLKSSAACASAAPQSRAARRETSVLDVIPSATLPTAMSP